MESNQNPTESKDQNPMEEEKPQDFTSVTVKPSDEMKEKKIKYGIMGEDIPIDPEATVQFPFLFKKLSKELDFSGERIGKIQGLENCKNLKKLFFRQNLIKEIEGLDSALELEEIELYDNKITQIKNISHLTKLKQFHKQSFSDFQGLGYFF